MSAKRINKCQICGKENLKPILFLGHVPLVNTMREIGKLPAEDTFYALEMVRCPDCTLVQNPIVVDPEIVFPPEYPYLSGTTKILRDDFADLYRETKEKLNLKTEDFIIDIGSNDGTLLSNYKDNGHKVLGIEPSKAADVANNKGISTLIKFFGKELAEQVKKEYGEAKLITAANVFAHIDNIHSVVEGIEVLLSDDGVFVSESHYLLGLIETVQYDTVYHEHLRYYALGSLINLFNSHNLEVFYAKRIPTHGGSIRVYAGREGKYPIDSSVDEILKLEQEKGITSGKALERFKERVIQSKTELIGLLGRLKKQGAKIYGIGAPSRASTLIAYTGIDDSLVDCIMEIKGSHKIGKYIPGTRIPVLEEIKLYEDQPEYAILFSWHIADELVPKLRSKGYKGKFIVPLPEPHII